MKYRIHKYNIEFDCEAEEIEVLTQAIYTVLVPSELKKIYFFAISNERYKDILKIKSINFVMPNNINESVYNKTRLLHNIRQGQHQLILVASETNTLNQAKWIKLCKQIQLKFKSA